MAVADRQTASLLDLRSSEVPLGVNNAHKVFAARASGAKLWDTDGKEYIDFVGGIGVVNVGHSHPRVVAAVKNQLARFSHTCFQVVMYEPYLRLAERLNALAPGPSKKKTLLLTTGAEATENAVKIAREYTGRPAVIAFHHAFHGRTLLALTMTGQSDPYKQRFGPFCSEVYHSPYPYEYHGWTCGRALSALDELFDTQAAPQKVAAIIVEPVLGEGGFVPAPAEFLRALRRRCDERGIVFICDEIQSGYGRTGTMFAIEESGVEPDLITVAKSMAGGLPLAGVIGKVEIMDAPRPGGLGGTFGGNPLACVAALATLDVIEQEHLLERSRRIGELAMRRLRALARRHAAIGDVRGRGAMVGIEFTGDADGKPSTVSRIIEQAHARGLLLLHAGAKANVIRILVPLVVTDDELEEGLGRLCDSCEAVLAPARAS